MIKILSLRLYGTVCTQVRYCCWRWVYSITTMLSWVLDGSHYDKEDGSVERARPHRRASKRWLYRVCPTQRRFVMLVKIFWCTWYVLLDFNDIHGEYLRKLLILLYVYIYVLIKQFIYIKFSHALISRFPILNWVTHWAL